MSKKYYIAEITRKQLTPNNDIQSAIGHMKENFAQLH